jgi:hypothetical protein
MSGGFLLKIMVKSGAEHTIIDNINEWWSIVVCSTRALTLLMNGGNFDEWRSIVVQSIRFLTASMIGSQKWCRPHDY